MFDEAQSYTIVLLPGMNGTADLFVDFAAVKPSTFQLLTLDYPVDVPLGYDELARLVHSRLPQDRPYVLLAESFSGPIGLMLAAEALPGMRGLILCCTFAKNPLPLLALFKPFVALLGFAGLPSLLSKLGHRALFGRFGSAHTKRALSAALRRLRPSVLQARVRTVLKVDTTALLSRVMLPVLYLSAQEDRVVPHSACEHLHHHLPQMRIASIAAPHMLLQTAPAEAWDAMTAFLDALTASKQDPN